MQRFHLSRTFSADAEKNTEKRAAIEKIAAE